VAGDEAAFLGLDQGDGDVLVVEDEIRLLRLAAAD
jgi:hypothetical protein